MGCLRSLHLFELHNGWLAKYVKIILTELGWEEELDDCWVPQTLWLFYWRSPDWEAPGQIDYSIFNNFIIANGHWFCTLWLKVLISENITHSIGDNLCFLASPALDCTNCPSTWPNTSPLRCRLLQQISCLEELNDSVEFPWNNCV